MSDSATAALVIVGGGPTGHAALKAYRSAGATGRAVLISEDTAAPYNRPPLSKDFLRGESSEDALPLEPPAFYSDGDTELKLADSVVSIDAPARSVTLRSGARIGYQQCILATGCEPARLDVPGADTTLRLRSLEQARRLRDEARTARRAVVIGSGFIGCEAAVSLAKRGLQVAMVSSGPAPQRRRLGVAASALIAGWLEAAGVEIHREMTVVDVGQQGTIRLSDGSSLAADLVLSAIGVNPRSELAAAVGVELREGRVVVDERMRTSIPGLLAAGDVVTAYNTAAHRHLAVEHWGEAERMGEIAGNTVAGASDEWSNPPGFWSEIGSHTLKYAAWGDGFDEAVPVHHQQGGLTVWYVQQGVVVGVLTSEADDDYERARPYRGRITVAHPERAELALPGPLIYRVTMRLVSMLPSATEIVYALGLGDELVGVTFECDEPAAARVEKTIVVGGRDTTGMTPQQIDRYVRDRMAAGEDLYTLHGGALAALAPDVILTQDLCRVCALPSGQVEEALSHLGCRADVVSLDPHTLTDVLDTILLVGTRTGTADRARRVVTALQARLDAVGTAVAGRPRPRVAVVEWVDPPFTAGHWVPDLVTAAGGEPVSGRPGQPSLTTSWEAIASCTADLVVVAPCGYHLDGAISQARAVADKLPGTPIWAIDADGIIVRPGPRLVDGVEALAALLHPGVVADVPGRAQRIA